MYNDEFIDPNLYKEIIKLIVASIYLREKRQKRRDDFFSRVTARAKSKYGDWADDFRFLLSDLTESYKFLDDYDYDHLVYIIALMYFGREYGNKEDYDYKEMRKVFLEEYPVKEYDWPKHALISQLISKSHLAAYLELGLNLLGY